MLKAGDFFSLDGHPHAALFRDVEYVWDALKKVKPYIREHITPNVGGVRKISGEVLDRTVVLFQNRVLEKGFTVIFGDATKQALKVEMEGEVLQGASVIYAGAMLMDDAIAIGKGTVVEPGALVRGPAIIGDNTEVRQGAYIRGDVVVGNKCVVGHTTEVKHSVFLGESKAGHFAYIGDSILGRANLGAGTKLANLKLDESQVIMIIEKVRYETGLKKFGSIIGDGVEIGCNSVTNPGTLVGKGTLVYPNSTMKGYLPPRSIFRNKKK